MEMSTLQLLDAKEAADQLDLSLARIHQFCKEGRLGQKVGGQWIIPADELQQFARIPRKTGRPPGKGESQPA